MSWKSYPVFSEIPNFEPNPVRGLGQISRGEVRFSQAEDFYSWDGDTGLAFGFRFITRDPESFRRLRDAVTAARGSGSAFYLPTWQPDFEIASDVLSGGKVISIIDGGLSDLSDDYPDTEGRVVFIHKPDGSLQLNRVVSAVDDGLNETLTLEDEIEGSVLASRDIMGLCYLSRLAENQAVFECFAPGRSFVDLRFLTVRITRKVSTVELVESEAP